MSFIVLIIGNSKSNHLGAQGTLNSAARETRGVLKVPYSFQVSITGKLALLMYMSEFCFHVLAAITSDVS